MILVADIGGTKVNMAYVVSQGSSWKVLNVRSYSSRKYARFEDILTEYTAAVPEKYTLACFGIAGTVINGSCLATNLPWSVKTKDLKALLERDGVYLINDLVAAVMGLPVVSEEKTVLLQEGKADSRGPVGLIAAGTGLGMALLLHDAQRYRPVASEGGHADYAPTNALEIELLQYLMRQFPHVCYERLLSGPGIINIFRFLCARGVSSENEQVLKDIEAAEDPAARISYHAFSGNSPVCRETMRLFAEIYGAAAGNLALTGVTTGGIYIAGGVAMKNAALFSEGVFIQSFKAKGRMQRFCEKVPVRLVTDEHVSLLGTAHFAALASRGEIEL